MNTFGEMPTPVVTLGTPPARQSIWNALLCAGLLFMLTLALTPISFGQGVTGTITGTVTDASGAAIKGAHVTIRAIETNAVRSAMSSEAGNYKVTQLAPGRYSVTIESAAFKKYQQDDVTLNIDQIAEINATLRVGSQLETIEVTASNPVLQTEQSSVGLVIDSSNLQNSPLNGRLMVLNLMALAPGVQNVATAQDAVPAFGVTLSVGTGRRNSYGGMATTLDGVINEEVSLERSEAEIPSIDALQEFKFITNGAPAEFGRASDIIVVSKSGANKYHGELLEFNRSKGTAAKPYSFVTPAPARSAYERNEYGGNFSGPISVPHLYNGTDRSFFFAAYEGFRMTLPGTLNTQEPTLLERQGNFSEFLAGGPCATSAKGTTITNPLTGNTYGGSYVMTADISPVSLQLLNLLYPKPTTSGCGTNTYEQVSYNENATRFSTRLDHRLTASDQLRGTYMRAFYGAFATG